MDRRIRVGRTKRKGKEREEGGRFGRKMGRCIRRKQSENRW